MDYSADWFVTAFEAGANGRLVRGECPEPESPDPVLSCAFCDSLLEGDRDPLPSRGRVRSGHSEPTGSVNAFLKVRHSDQILVVERKEETVFIDYVSQVVQYVIVWSHGSPAESHQASVIRGFCESGMQLFQWWTRPF